VTSMADKKIEREGGRAWWEDPTQRAPVVDETQQKTIPGEFHDAPPPPDAGNMFHHPLSGRRVSQKLVLDDEGNAVSEKA
jgi:hypothetical protein